MTLLQQERIKKNYRMKLTDMDCLLFQRPGVKHLPEFKQLKNIEKRSLLMQRVKLFVLINY